MQFSQLESILNPIYNDRFDIYRTKLATNPDGTSDNRLSDVPIYSDIPCSVSFNGNDMPDIPANIDLNVVNVVSRIICGLNKDVQKGDTIHVRRIDAGKQYDSFKGFAAEPNKTPICQIIYIWERKKDNPVGEICR